MSKVVCPYCFHRFNRNEVMFRCVNVANCENEADPILEKFCERQQRKIGRVIPSPKGFLGLHMGTPKSAVCPKCKYESHLMICPHCHNNIPTEMVLKKGFVISIIGARSSGKTIYITTLINELETHGWEIIPDLSLTARNVSENPEYNTESRYKRDFYNVIYKDNNCPPQTDIGAFQSKIPLIYELSRYNGDSIFLVFYDTAGENFTDIRNIAGNVRFLNESDAIIFLLDSMSVPYVREKLNIKGMSETRYDAILANIIQYFRQHGGENNSIFSKPIALTFSKIDEVLVHEDDFAETAISGMSVRNNSSFLRGEGVSIDEMETNSDSLIAAIAAWGEMNFVNQVKNNFKNARYFGISALGGAPSGNKITQKVKPYRVLDPLVWILHELKYKLPIQK